MENQHPDIDKPIQTLKCCCCGGYTKGRQFHNQDTGFGLGFCCLRFVKSRCEDVERTYGVLGIHYMDPSSAEPMKILDAFNLAATLHAGITDKAGRPYIEHLARVFLRVIEAGGSRDQQVAALLHDAIEDGLITNEGLIQAGVPEIAIELINALTKKDGQSYLEYIAGVKSVPAAVLVKHCDLADNSDEDRLSRLSANEASRLREKYRQALAALIA